MASTVKIGLEVSDNGKLKNLTKEAKALSGELTAAQKAAKSIGVGVASGRKGPTKEENIEYRNARGVAGTGGGGSRDFAKQAQGLGGLVHLYATFAANIFAVSAAFMALDKAAQYTQMIEGAKALEATTGAALRNIASGMKEVTDGALSMQESLRLTSLGSAAGLSSKRILELTKGAKGASLALGRDMSDSIDRVIRGVAKLEPELLDELGVVTRAQEAYTKYAKSIGISADELTSYQKTVAYSTAVAEELNRKFGAIADKVPANPYAKFLGQLKDVGTELLTLVNKVVTPVIETITNNVELMVAGILLVIRSLTVRAIPEIGKLFAVSPDAIAKQEAHLKELEAQRAKYFEVQKATAIAAKDSLIAIKQQEMAALVKVEQEGLAKIQSFVQTNYRKTTSTGAQAILGATSMGALQTDPTVKKSLAAKEMATRRALAKAELEDNAASTALTKEKVALSKAELVQIEEINRLLSVQVVESKEVLSIKAQIAKLDSQQLITETEMTKRTALRSELLKTQATIAKQNRSATLASTQFTFGKDSEEYRAKDSLTKRQVLKTTMLSLADNPLLASDEPGKRLNKLGKAALGANMAFLSLKEGISSAGAVFGKAIGFLSIWGTTAMIAWEIISFGVEKLGLVNKKTDELNKTIEDSTSVLETATSVLSQYNKALLDAESSLSGIVARNTISASTMEQITDSIGKQVDALIEWKANSAYFSEIWDSIGTSKYDEVREQVISQLEALAQVSQGAAKEEALNQARKAKGMTQEKDGLLALIMLKQDVIALAEKEKDRLNNETSQIKDFETAASNAAQALQKLQEKEWIKDDKRRTVVEFLKTLQKEINTTGTTMEKQIALLAKLPAEFAGEADASLSRIREIAQAIQAISEANNDIAKIDKARADLLGKFIEIPKVALDDLVDITGSDNIGNKMLELAVKNAKIKEKLTDEGIAKEERNRLESEERLNKLKIEFLNSAIRDDLVARKKAADEYASYEKMKKEQARIDALTWAEAFGDGIFTAIVKAINKVTGFLPDWLMKLLGGGAPPKPVGVDADPRAAGMKVINESGLKEQLIEDLKKENVSLKLEKEAARQTALGNKTSKDSARSKEFALQKEEIKAQLEYLQALTRSMAVLATADERRLGYISQTTLEAQKQNALDIIAVKHKQQEVDILDKYKKSLPEIGKAKAGSLKDSALKSLKLETETEIATAKAVSQVAIEKSKNLKYQQEILRPLENQLQLERAVLEAKKALGGITPLAEIAARFELERKAAENALNAATQGLASDNIAVKNAKDKYDLTVAELALKEKVAIETQKIADAQERANLALEVSNMYLEDMLSREYRFEGSAERILHIQDLITEQYRNQIKAIQLKNNPATEALEIEKATLEYLKAQAEAKERLHEIDKRNINEKTAPEAMNIIYEEAAKRVRDFNKTLKDGVTAAFDSIYSAMDTALETLVERVFTKKKLNLKDIFKEANASIAADSRKWLAEKAKSAARTLIAKTMELFGFKMPKKTNEDKLTEYRSMSVEQKAEEADVAAMQSRDFLEELVELTKEGQKNKGGTGGAGGFTSTENPGGSGSGGGGFMDFIKDPVGTIKDWFGGGSKLPPGSYLIGAAKPMTADQLVNNDKRSFLEKSVDEETYRRNTHVNTPWLKKEDNRDNDTLYNSVSRFLNHGDPDLIESAKITASMKYLMPFGKGEWSGANPRPDASSLWYKNPDFGKNPNDLTSEWFKFTAEASTGVVDLSNSFLSMTDNFTTNVSGIFDVLESEEIPQLTQSFDDFYSNSIAGVTDVSGTFSSLTSSMDAGLTGVFGDYGVFGGLMNSMATNLTNTLGGIGGGGGGGGGGLLGSLFSGLSGGGSGGGFFGDVGGNMMDSGNFMAGASNYTPSWNDLNLAYPAFANGGIMSEYGPLKLNKYASGGIANTPQMAIFGEGSKPEAFVPLPDGRNIPVKMTGESKPNETKQQVVNVTNNFTIQGNVSRETQQEIARKVGVSINRSLQRNG